MQVSKDNRVQLKVGKTEDKVDFVFLGFYLYDKVPSVLSAQQFSPFNIYEKQTIVCLMY